MRVPSICSETMFAFWVDYLLRKCSLIGCIVTLPLAFVSALGLVRPWLRVQGDIGLRVEGSMWTRGRLPDQSSSEFRDKALNLFNTGTLNP